MSVITLLALINVIRNQPLILSEDLTHRAEIRAEILCDRKQWSHKDWENSFDGLTGAKGENLARGFDSEIDMFLALYNSESHKRNMMYGGFKNIGIADGDCGNTVFLFH